MCLVNYQQHKYETEGSLLMKNRFFWFLLASIWGFVIWINGFLIKLASYNDQHRIFEIFLPNIRKTFRPISAYISFATFLQIGGLLIILIAAFLAFFYEDQRIRSIYFGYTVFFSMLIAFILLIIIKLRNL